MENQYIEKRDDGYWIAGTRVSLDSVVLLFLEGLSPETIAAECLPVLTLEQVYGAITYYLSHQNKIDVYLKQNEAEFKALREKTNDSEFSKKLAKARRQVEMTRS